MEVSEMHTKLFLCKVNYTLIFRCILGDDKGICIKRIKGNKGAGFNREIKELLKFKESAFSCKTEVAKSEKRKRAKLINIEYESSKRVKNESQVKDDEEVKKPFEIIRDVKDEKPLPPVTNDKLPLIQYIQPKTDSCFKPFSEVLNPSALFFEQFYPPISFGGFQLNNNGQYNLPYAETVPGNRELGWHQILHHKPQ